MDRRFSSLGQRSGGIGAAVAAQFELHRLSPIPLPAGFSALLPPVAAPAAPLLQAVPAAAVDPATLAFSQQIATLRDRVFLHLLDRVDTGVIVRMSRDEVREALSPVVSDILRELKLTLNGCEQTALERVILQELTGLGPLEDLLADPAVSDILVNCPNQVNVERRGRLELTDVRFRDANHLFQIAQRICNGVGRRIDQSSPLADARLPDGSRANIVAHPLALKWPTISIRKFSTKSLTIDSLIEADSLSPDMGKPSRSPLPAASTSRSRAARARARRRCSTRCRR
jgi:pilus assembly protein CpaF